MVEFFFFKAIPVLFLAFLFFFLKKVYQGKNQPFLLFNAPWLNKKRQLSALDLPNFFFGAAFLLMLFAFLDIDFGKKEIQSPYANAFFLLLDVSGSMRETLVFDHRIMSRMDYLKEVTEAFIKETDPSDLIGLITFSRSAYSLSPLTFDREALLKIVESLKEETDPEMDGTNIGYALYKALQFFQMARMWEERFALKPPFEFENRFVITVTDGFPYPNPQDRNHPLLGVPLSRVSEKMKKEGIKLYIIGIEPKLLLPEFALEKSLMREASMETGGDFFIVEDPSETLTLLERIERENIKRVSSPSLSEKTRLGSISSFFLMISLALIVISTILESVVIKSVP